MKSRLISWLLATNSLLAASLASAQTTEEPVVLDRFEVNTQKDLGYRSTNATTAARMDVPIVDIPQNIAVYNKEWIEDTMSFDVSEVLDFEPTFINNFPPRSGGLFNIRGFDSSEFLLDGMSQTRGGNLPVPLINVERVEVLKGPSAILYGEGAIGGVINRISKVPRFEKASQLRFVYGMHERNSRPIRFVSGDFTGPITNGAFLTPEGGLAYRFNFSLDDSGLYRKGSGIREGVLALSVLWKIAANTSLTVHANAGHASQTPLWEQPVSVINGKPVYGVQRPDGTIATFSTGDYSPIPDRERFARRQTTSSFLADFRHRFSNTLQFRTQLAADEYDQKFRETFPDQNFRFAVNLDPLTNQPVIGHVDPITGVFVRNQRAPVQGVRALDYLLQRKARHFDRAGESFSLRSEFVWDVATGPIDHHLLGGFSYFSGDSRLYRSELRPPADVTQYQPWQLVSMLYPNGDGPISAPRNASWGEQFPVGNVLVSNTLVSDENRSFYASDLISLFQERLWISAGWRKQKNERISRNFVNNSRNLLNANSDTFSFGAVIHLNRLKNVSLYANANESFEPVYTRSIDGYELPPITGEQVEVGLKVDLMGGRLSGTVAVFEIERVNLPVEIEEDVYRPLGAGVSSDGWEVNVNYYPRDDWQIYAGYAEQSTYNHSRPANYPIKEFNNVPETGFSLFTSYRPKTGKWAGWFGTFGAIYKGDRWTDWTDRPDLAYRIEGTWRLDASIGKNFRVGSARVHVKNLLNEEMGMNKARYWDANPDTLREIRFELRLNY